MAILSSTLSIFLLTLYLEILYCDLASLLSKSSELCTGLLVLERDRSYRGAGDPSWWRPRPQALPVRQREGELHHKPAVQRIPLDINSVTMCNIFTFSHNVGHSRFKISFLPYVPSTMDSFTPAVFFQTTLNNSELYLVSTVKSKVKGFLLKRLLININTKTTRNN